MGVRKHLFPFPPPDRLFELDNSVTKKVPIVAPNDTFSDSPQRDLSAATLLAADTLLASCCGDVEFEKLVRGGEGRGRLLAFITVSPFLPPLLNSGGLGLRMGIAHASPMFSRPRGGAGKLSITWACFKLDNFLRFQPST